MRVPFSGRLGIYVITFGFPCDLALHYIWGFEYLYPGIGGLSVLLLPVGILLLLGSAMVRLNERRSWTRNRISLTSVGPQPGELLMGSTLLPLQEPQTAKNGLWPPPTTV
jgi:hypothetical protein